MRKGHDGLATLIQEHLKKDLLGASVRVPRQEYLAPEDPFWDGTGLCLFTKRIDRGNFWWPGWRSQVARCRCRRRNSRRCSKRSIGVRRSASGDRIWPGEIRSKDAANRGKLLLRHG
ncbi:hypothetical protein [Mesorhizobium sp. M0138]